MESMVSVGSPAAGEDDLGSIIGRLRAEHRALEARLDLLNRRLHLSADEQVERKDLQKLKLKTKDRIFALERKSGRA
jgi:hypothetical protein